MLRSILIFLLSIPFNYTYTVSDLISAPRNLFVDFVLVNFITPSSHTISHRRNIPLPHILSPVEHNVLRLIVSLLESGKQIRTRASCSHSDMHLFPYVLTFYSFLLAMTNLLTVHWTFMFPFFNLLLLLCTFGLTISKHVHSMPTHDYTYTSKLCTCFCHWI